MPVLLHPSLNGGPSNKDVLVGLDRELAFSVDEYESRISKVRDGMAAIGAEILITREPSNVLYLSGFQTFSVFGGECVIIPVEGDPILVVHPPELGTALLHTWFDRVFGYPEDSNRESYLAKLIVDLLKSTSRIAIEKQNLGITVSEYEALQGMFHGLEFVDGSSIISTVRRIKSSNEIEYLRQSAKITDLGIYSAIEAVVEGNTDGDVAAAAAEALISGGSEYMSLSPIVTTGRRSGILHSNHKRRNLERGDVILMEMGASYQRYTSPMMRTVTIGQPESDVQRGIDACLDALNKVLGAIGPGVSVEDVARVGWEGIDRVGSGMVFHGVFGYSVGTSLPPKWSDGTAAIKLGLDIILEPGMVFHHPVALRDLGKYGVAFSETSVVTNDGCEILTSVPRHPNVR